MQANFPQNLPGFLLMQRYCSYVNNCWSYKQHTTSKSVMLKIHNCGICLSLFRCESPNNVDFAPKRDMHCSIILYYATWKYNFAFTRSLLLPAVIDVKSSVNFHKNLRGTGLHNTTWDNAYISFINNLGMNVKLMLLRLIWYQNCACSLSNKEDQVTNAWQSHCCLKW